ncbi:MAG: hypothetical protein ABIQ39_05995 [Ilumatobacteraceae bacterium]
MSDSQQPPQPDPGLPDPGLPDDRAVSAVSAYIDGNADAAQRATVESSISLLEEVAALRRVRSALQQQVPVPVALRESAISAALALFDQRAEPVNTGEPVDLTKPVNLAARRRYRRWAGASIAAAVALIVGLAAIRPGTSPSTTAGVAESSTAESSTAMSAAGVDAGTERSAQNPDAASAGGRSGGQSGTSTAAQTANPSSTYALPAPAAPAAGSDSAAPGDKSFASPPVTIATPQQLLDLPVPEAPGDTTSTRPCLPAGQRFLADVVYRSTPAIAVLDEATHVRAALADGTCVILAEINDSP